MTHYHVRMIKIKDHEVVKLVKFDNKEDAEHYAKNESAADSKHSYEIQKSTEGEFATIKSYLNGKEVSS